jgi:hypothetical protein
MKKTQCAGQVARMGQVRNAHKPSVRKSEGTIWKPYVQMITQTETDFKKTVYEGVDWIALPQHTPFYMAIQSRMTVTGDGNKNCIKILVRGPR